jgi:hypothetical protein
MGPSIFTFPPFDDSLEASRSTLATFFHRLNADRHNEKAVNLERRRRKRKVKAIVSDFGAEWHLLSPSP